MVRTTLTNAVQVGGSIGYDGSYTVAAPSGTTAQQVAQAQQTVTEDQQSLAADEQAESDASTADNQAITADRTSVDTDRSTLSSDKAKKSKDCAGKGRPAGVQPGRPEGEPGPDPADPGQQQLARAQSTATRDHDQNQAKVASDETKLQGDQANLVSLQATDGEPGHDLHLPAARWATSSSGTSPCTRSSNEPVPLLYGSIAAYRAFYVGMSDGADVGELTHDLIALGYGAGLTQSNHYSSATATAVERWQTRARPACDRRDPARRGGVRARSDPGHVGHAFGRRVRRRRGRRWRRHRADGHELPPRSSPSTWT